MDILRCTMVDHAQLNKSIEGICIDKQCKASQRILCMICSTKYHQECQRNQVLTKEALIDQLILIKDGIQNQKSMLAILLDLKAQLLKQFEQLEQQYKQSEELRSKLKDRIDQITSSIFTRSIWLESYEILQQQENPPQQDKEILEKLNKIQVHLNELQNINVKLLSVDISNNQKIKIIKIAKPHDEWDQIKSLTTITLPQAIFSIDCSLNEKYIACSYEEKIRIYNPKQQIVADLVGHKASVFSVKFSPCTRFVASGSQDKTIKIWEFLNQKQYAISLDGHEDSVNCVDYSIDGQFIVSGSDDYTVRIWNCQSYKQDAILLGHSESVKAVQYSPNGQFIISGSWDRSIRIWDYTRKQQVKQFNIDKGIQCLKYSSNSKFIITGNDRIQIWDSSTGQQIGKDLVGQKYAILCIAISQDSQYIASGNCDNTIRLWKVATGQQLEEITHSQPDWINAIQFSPNGKFLLSGSADGSLQITPVNLSKYQK